MVIIKTRCLTCGEVDLTADKVQLRIAIGGPTGSGNSSYAFDCPKCSSRVRKPADTRVVQLLISGGITPELVGDDDPTEETFDTLAEREAAAREAHPSRAGRAAPQITYDDILEFHREIEAGVLESFLRSAAA
jgi:hypothetical protein